MPIRIPDALPATDLLAGENIFVMTEYRAMHQDIRPLRVVLLNLMPTKIATETQILRKLSNTPLQIEITLMHMASHDSKNVSEQHLETFYRTFDEVSHERFDGMIITGAPVELLDFQQVDYWDELCEIMNWTRTNVHSTLHICWGAQAGIYYHYGVPKHPLNAKMSGVFEHRQLKLTSPLMRGFDDTFWAPHSRYTEVRIGDIEAHPDLELLAISDEAGVYIAKSTDSRNFFVFGHPEYDRVTLKGEYERDIARGLDIAVPRHYFPGDDPNQMPRSNWRAHAQLLYTNWLNYYVYQTTPYDVRRVGLEETHKISDEMAAADARKTEAAERPTRWDSAKEAAASSPYLRAPNEDDDGYDPYSDRREEPPLFEPDPWK
ncbi:MAG TPA: homoserine O-succinyltransferase [Eggerthellaceae bacterium]|nr:homoserine O-succinyltransferase [Eggerthellaceae bacterium]